MMRKRLRQSLFVLQSCYTATACLSSLDLVGKGAAGPACCVFVRIEA